MKNYQDLVARAKAGDNAAAQALYEDTVDSVHYIISRLVDRAEEVEDLTQDVYVAAFSHLDRLGVPQAFRKWIHQIAANAAKNYLKKCKPVLFSTDEEEERMLASIPAVGEDFLPEEYAQNQELRKVLMAAIDSLPEKQRTAVYLYYYEDMPVRKLSEMLEVGENTVKSRLNAGRAGIKEALRRAGITGTAMVTVLAMAMRAEATEYEVSAASRNAIWNGVQKSMAWGTSAAAGSAAAGAAGSTSTGAAGAVTAAKAGFLTTVAGKITAAAVAVAVLAGGALGITAATRKQPEQPSQVQVETQPSDTGAWESKYGIPEEMRFIEELVEQDGEEESADLLKLVRHEFGSLKAVCEFDDGARIEYYGDGYKKVYLEQEVTQQIPVDNDQEYLLKFTDAEGEWFSELSYSGSPMRGSFNDQAGYTKVMTNQDGRAVYYLTESYLREREPVRLDVVPESDPDGEPVLTLTREETGLPAEVTIKVAEVEEEPAEEATEATTQPAETVDTEPAVTTKVLDLAGCSLEEVTAALGDYTQSYEFYWFDGGYVGYVYAYGTDLGNNYIQAPLNRLISNCPDVLTLEQLQEYLPGGERSYDEMDSVYCYVWEYRGIPVVIYENDDGTYTPDSIFCCNCYELVQAQRKEKEGVKAELFQLPGKTKGEIEAIVGTDGYFEGQYGCLIYNYQDSFVWVYMDDYENGTCIGFYTPLKNVVDMASAYVAGADLKAYFGDSYRDPWNGNTAFQTMYQGGQLRIFQDMNDEPDEFSGESAVNFRLAGKAFFDDSGSQAWTNSSYLFYGGVIVHSQTDSELVCEIEYCQLTPPNRSAGTGRITLTSTDGVTYTASGVVDTWESEMDVVVTMLEEAAKVSFGYTKMGDLANFCFADSFIVYQ